MELLGVALAIVLFGALFSIGWRLAPLILVLGVVYVGYRYRKEIPIIVKKIKEELRKEKKK